MAITTDTAAATIATAKENGNTVTLVLADDTRVTGTPISVNTKGVNLKIDGKTRSFALSRIDVIGEDVQVAVVDDIPEAPEGGATPAFIAEAFGMAAKDVRIVLRRLGMGVGKGQRYALTTDDIRKVKIEIDREAAELAAQAEVDA